MIDQCQYNADMTNNNLINCSYNIIFVFRLNKPTLFSYLVTRSNELIKKHFKEYIKISTHFYSLYIIFAHTLNCKNNLIFYFIYNTQLFKII